MTWATGWELYFFAIARLPNVKFMLGYPIFEGFSNDPRQLYVETVVNLQIL